MQIQKDKWFVASLCHFASICSQRYTWKLFVFASAADISIKCKYHFQCDIHILARIRWKITKHHKNGKNLMNSFHPNKSWQSITERGKCLNTFILLSVCVFVNSVLTRVAAANWWAAIKKKKKTWMTFLHLSFGHHVCARRVNPSGSCKQATIKAYGESCVCFFYGCGTSFQFNAALISNSW